MALPIEVESVLALSSHNNPGGGEKNSANKHTPYKSSKIKEERRGEALGEEK